MSGSVAEEFPFGKADGSGWGYRFGDRMNGAGPSEEIWCKILAREDEARLVFIVGYHATHDLIVPSEENIALLLEAVRKAYGFEGTNERRFIKEPQDIYGDLPPYCTCCVVPGRLAEEPED